MNYLGLNPQQLLNSTLNVHMFQRLRTDKHTFALHDVSGAVKVCGGISRAGDTVVLAKLPLICAHGTADAAVCAGVVVMSWRTLDCKNQGQ